MHNHLGVEEKEIALSLKVTNSSTSPIPSQSLVANRSLTWSDTDVIS